METKTSAKTYIKFLKSLNYSQKTLQLYKSVLINVLNVDNNSTEQIMKIITNNTKSASYQQLCLAIYKSFLKYIEDTQTLKLCRYLKTKKEVKKFFDVLNYKQVLDLTKWENENDTRILKHKVIIRFLFETGIRISELKTLKMDLNGQLYVLGKGNKQREIFYNKNTYEKLRELFPTNSDIFTPRTIELMIKKILGSCYTPHSLRRSFATYMLQNGADIKVVQLLMGHRSVITTLNYQQNTRDYSLGIYKKFMNI